ncbi:MAG: hypothetical protein ACKPKO_30930, partial [Candidatus Fonsibacter sp.]
TLGKIETLSLHRRRRIILLTLLAVYLPKDSYSIGYSGSGYGGALDIGCSGNCTIYDRGIGHGTASAFRLRQRRSAMTSALSAMAYPALSAMAAPAMP